MKDSTFTRLVRHATSTFISTILVTLGIAAMATSAAAQKPAYQSDIDWAATNFATGGSVDCPQQYVSEGVAPAIFVGGRSAVINEALLAAYNQDFSRAFNLVLLTQCHNPDEQQDLNNVGQKAVLIYLLENWHPTGMSIAQMTQFGQAALQVVLAM